MPFVPVQALNQDELEKLRPKTTWEKIKQNASEISENIKTDASNYYQSLQRQAEVNPLSLTGTPMEEGLTNAPAPDQTQEQQQAYQETQAAGAKLYEDYGSEAVMAAGFVPGPVGAVSQILLGMGAAKKATSDYQTAGEGLEGAQAAGNALNPFDFAYRFATNQDNIRTETLNKIQEKPLSGANDVLVGFAPAGLMAKDAYSVGIKIYNKPSMMDEAAQMALGKDDILSKAREQERKSYDVAEPVETPAYRDMAESIKQETESVSALGDIERKLQEEINTEIKPVSPDVGMSVKETSFKPKEESVDTVKFSNPETEARWQEASKGIQTEGLMSKIKSAAESFWRKATRTYEDLPNTAEFSPLKNALLYLEKQKGVAGDRTARLLQGITLKLDKSGMDLFTRKVILDDLAKSEGKLPFGLTKESLSKDKALVDNAIVKSQVIKDAIAKRKEMQQAVKTDYVNAMKDIGFDVSDKLNREDYFRRQVLEYANAKAIAGTGEKLKTPTNRNFLKGRQGSEKDINANYLQAEYEVISQMLHDTELAKVIKSIDKNYSIRTQLFDEFGNQWRDNIPEGYTTWQPREGNSFYMASSIPEKLASQVLSGVMEEVGIGADQIRQILAKGAPFKELVVKQEVADTLNKINQVSKDNPVTNLAKTITQKWKQFVLFGPTRFIKYELRNVTGDIDAVFAMNKDSFRYVSDATKELYQTIYGDRSMTPEMGEWFKRGGMESTSLAAELPDVNKLRMFEKFAGDKTNFEKFKGLWSGYWSKVSNLNTLREGILRYASYRSFLKQMEDNAGKPKSFAASSPEEVMALPDIRDRAFKLSNDMMGAYDNVSVLGKNIRDTIYPFWSFSETNFSRYMQFFRNQEAEGTLGSAIARKLVGNVLIRSPYYAYSLGSFVVKAGAFWAMLQAYNNLVFPGEEKDLPQDEQERPHIILGRDSDGKVRYFNRLGSFPDFLEWFGLDTPVKDVKDFLDGSRGIKQIAEDMLKSPVNKVVQGITPVIKTPAELLYGKTAYPDAFNLRTIKDRGLQVANTLGLASEFKALSRTETAQELGINPRPGKPYFSQETADNFVMYKAEPNQTAYYDILDKKREFLKKTGSGEGEYSSPRSEALRNYKIALRLKDEDSAAFYLTEYEKLGGTKKTLKKSLDSMEPLSGLNSKEKKQFEESLDNEEKKKLEKAKIYYQTVMMGK